MHPDLVPYRLAPQRLAGPPAGDPVDAVRHLGAVQAQLPDMAAWGIGRRSGSTADDVRSALDDGRLLRTHVLRPTWHVVAPDVLRLLLDVTTPRVERLWASTLKPHGITPERAHAAAEVALDAIDASAAPPTRAELADAVTAAGLDDVAPHLAHVAMWLELQGLVASGPWRGRQQTYRRIELPPATGSPDERLAELARLYVRGHGPSSAQDLAWWTSLTLTQARRAIELAELRPVRLADRELVTDDGPVAHPSPAVLLLPTFDELTSYVRSPADYDAVAVPTELVMRSAGLLFLDGALSGLWSRTVRAQHVDVAVTTSAELSSRHLEALHREAHEFGVFLGREARVTTTS